MGEMAVTSLWMYGLAVIVSMVIAVIIRTIVRVLGRMEPAPVATAPRTPLPQAGVPVEHVAAIAAAVQSMIGAHRILHIDDGGHRRAWVGEGRLAHHASHDVHPPHHRR